MEPPTLDELLPHVHRGVPTGWLPSQQQAEAARCEHCICGATRPPGEEWQVPTDHDHYAWRCFPGFELCTCGLVRSRGPGDEWRAPQLAGR